MLDWRAASWLPAYLVGLGIIVFLSSFGPLDDPVLEFGPDMIVCGIFSVGIYYWAMAVALSKEQIDEMLEEVELPEEEGLAPVH